MITQTSFSRIDHSAGIEGLVKVLPDLQANIRRYLAVRKYETLKVEKQARRKVELKEKREKQRNYMQSLSNPSRRTPIVPKVSKEKAAAITSPAMASRVKVPKSHKRVLSVEEYEQKYSMSPEVEKKPLEPTEVEPTTNIMPVQKFDDNITKLMKNINDITLTLNMHDSTIIPHTVNNVRIHGQNYYHEEKIGYFDFSNTATSPPKTVTFGDSKSAVKGSVFPTSTAHNSPESRHSQLISGISPTKVTAAGGVGAVVHSDQISAVLAGIEAEYAVLARTNEQIKAVIARSTVPSVVGDSSVASDTPTVASSTHISTHNSHYEQQFSKPQSHPNSKNNSPARVPSEGLSMYTISTMDSDDESTARPHRSHNSSSRSNLSEAYVPIRRSGDVKLDMMVQETLIRANNSILDTAIQEHKVYEGSELDRVMHKVALQINDTYQAIEGEEESTRKLSTSTVDSVGLDALTRSITAIQQGGIFAAKTAATGSDQDTSSVADYPSTLPSEQSSANNSMDSQITADSQVSELSHVSELTMAIQDILANLSGGLFDRARLQLSGPEIPEGSEMEQTIQRNDSNFGEAMMKRSLSQQKPLEMADYLASVNGLTSQSTHTDDTNNLYNNHSAHQMSPNRVNAIFTHLSVQDQGEQEAQDLRELLAHQERSMQLIRDSIRAIEAQAQAQSQAQAEVEVKHSETNTRELGLQSLHGVSEDTHVYNSATERNPYYAVERQSLAEVRVSPKPKVKKKKIPARIDSPEEQHAPTAKEMAMLRNLGSYLQRQKLSQQHENKSLSYDELMQKAQKNLGLHHIKLQNQAALREEHLQRQFRQELIYDKFHYSQQKQEEEERRAARAAKKEKETAQAKARAQHAMMYPVMYESDHEEEEIGSATASNVDHLEYERGHYQHGYQYNYPRAAEMHQNSSYSYGQNHSQNHNQNHSQNHSQTHSQASLKGYSGAHMDAPHRPYDDSHRQYNAYPHRQPDYDHHSNGYSAYQHHNHTASSIKAHTSHIAPTKAQKSPPKEPFNMSDALLQAPVMTFSDNGRSSVGSKTKASAPKKRKSVDHIPHYAMKTHAHMYPAPAEASDGGWNDRFGAAEHKHGNIEGFGLKKDAMRESAEDLYHSQRVLKQQQKEDELQEYRASYSVAARALEDDDEEDHRAEVSSQRVAPRKPAHSSSHGHALATHNNTYANSHSSHTATYSTHSTQGTRDTYKQHSPRQPSGTYSPPTVHKKKVSGGGGGASKLHHADGEFDKGLMNSIEHLHLKPPKSIRSSASVEKSPRALAVRLLHPFK